ncbi:septation ring formation regulator EzrA [Synechococcus sp. CCY 9618]|uniref:septation ring formation regulator EzrA n=1 Tax=Synechococcus sp. CCY 9618 TaxID=2815602 RepID=UPI001C212254|nr:septation ring formation regulator EzrA [Synechococcus sp. CCY 9618]
MGQRDDTMVSITDLDDDRSRRRPQLPAGPPPWTGWLQIGLSTMLGVLFLVMLAKTREQNQLLRQLEERVQGLENSRALDRTSVLEEQQRAMVERLQSLEAGAKQLEAIEEQQEQWRQALTDLQSRRQRRPAPSADRFPSPPPPPAPPTPPSDGGVLRPPGPASP